MEAGIRLYELHVVLEKCGMALSNLGSISDQSIAGAIATATHGKVLNIYIYICEEICNNNHNHNHNNHNYNNNPNPNPNPNHNYNHNPSIIMEIIIIILLYPMNLFYYSSI